MSRAAPGPQLSAGRLRVDAARAIAKLREYQLVDRTGWVLEAVRAAVASGATAITLDGDANDVWLSWRGEPWPIEALPRLFDELVSPEPARASQHLRLLAAAINSALGLEPAYVDVYVITDGAARRVRYTPEVLVVTDELGDAPLRQLDVDDATPPAPGPGMAVHLRRRAGLETLGHLFRGEPPEIAVARDACGDVAVSMWIRGEAHGRDAHVRDLVREPLGRDLDGWVALTIPARTDRGAVLEIAEHGVVLARYTLPLAVPDAVGPVPLRLFVDGPRMPTNASRSEVRRQGHPIAAAEQRATELVPRVVARLIDTLHARPDDALHRHAALALLAAAIAGADWTFKVLGLASDLRALASLPLVRNAVGAPRPLFGTWRSLGVHVGDKPFDAELGPWLEEVLWVGPGDPAVRLLEGAAIDHRAVRAQARSARRQLRLQKRFERHARREAKLNIETPAIIAAIGAGVEGSCVPDAAVADLEGEVGVFGTGGSRGMTQLLLDGRPIETMTWSSSISFAAIVDNPELQPDEGYRRVVRDAQLHRVEVAVRGTLVRAIEMLSRARDGGDLPRGARRGRDRDGDPAQELALVRRAIVLAREAGWDVASTSPLATYPAWRTAAGAPISLASLAEQRAIGVCAPGSGAVAPGARILVAADADERRLLETTLEPATTVIDYDRRSPRRTLDRALDLARALAERTQLALVIREPGIAAAIAPDASPKLMVGHAGVALTTSSYAPQLAPCSISVDLDDAIPDALWSTLDDDAGFSSRDHRPWEIALVRAIARAMCGDFVEDLVLRATPRLDDASGGAALCAALVDHAPGPAALLGEDLADRLRASSIVRVLGGAGPITVDALVGAHRGAIPFVAPDATPVPDDEFRPLLATPIVASAIATLSGRAVVDATAELARRHADTLRRARRALHLQQPETAIDLPGTSVEIPGGRVGVGRGGLLLRLRVLGRPFAEVRRDNEPPLVAEVDVPEAAVDAEFAELDPAAVERMIVDVCAAADRLIIEITRAAPQAIADDPDTLALVAACLSGLHLDADTRMALSEAAAWPTVQGDRASINAARLGASVRYTTWTGAWLGPSDGQPRDRLDDPILLVPAAVDAPERRVITELALDSVDVTDKVRGLQSQRRMARGLLPPPALPATSMPRVPLSALDAAGKALGAGEIALSLRAHTVVYLHSGGEPTCEVELEHIAPPVEIAIERPDLCTEIALLGSLDDGQRAALAKLVRPAAEALARDVCRRGGHAWMTPLARRHLRAAVFAQAIAHEELGGAPVMETTDGSWWPWSVVQEQLERHQTLWWTGLDDSRLPLDDTRRVFRLSETEVAAAKVLGYMMVDGRIELGLDERARRNLARPLATAAELTWEESIEVLAIVPLPGDGVTAPRGVVAPLAPGRHGRRALRAMCALHPFDVLEDPCAWPTLTVIDDARFAPDRTISRPETDEVWHAAVGQIREASEHALRALVRPPEGVLAHRWIGPELHGGVSPYAASPQLQIRGALWLVEPTMCGVVILHREGRQSSVPIDGAPVAGKLFAHATSADRGEGALQALARRVYAMLLVDVQTKLAERPAEVTAHLARGLALGHLDPDDVREARFACFLPTALDARQLVALLRGSATVDVLDPGADGTGVVDDGSALSRIVLLALGGRTRRKPVEVVVAPEPTPAPVPAARPVTPPPKPRHPLADLADALDAKLLAVGVASHVSIDGDDEDAPIARVRGDRVSLGAAHPTVRAIDARWRRGGDDAGFVIEQLAAHLVTVLNRALVEVTDAAEGFAIARMLG